MILLVEVLETVVSHFFSYGDPDKMASDLECDMLYW